MNSITKTFFRSAVCIGTMLVLHSADAAAAQLKKSEDDCSWSTTVTVKRGEEHTFWVKGLTPETAVSFLDVEGTCTYKEEGETYEEWIYPSESVDVENSSGGWDKYLLLTADDWEWIPESVKSVKFKVIVDGWYDYDVPANNKFDFGHSSGRSDYPSEPPPPPAPEGTGERPKTITPQALKAGDILATSAKATDCMFAEETESASYGGKYTINVTLEKDRKYFFGIDNCSNLALLDSAASGNLLASAEIYEGWSLCSEAYAFIPTSGGKYTITVDGDVGDQFGFYCVVLPKLTPEEHGYAELAVGTESEVFTPGYMNKPDNSAYDAVIDEMLFKITGYKKDGTYVFRTKDASCDLMMCLYDKSGKCVATNYYMSSENSNVSLVWTATAAYAANNAMYLGVCQRLEAGAELVECDVTVSAETVTLESDTVALPVVPDSTEQSPELAIGAEASKECGLGASKWVNTFAIAARAGTTYRVKAVCGSPRGLTLGTEVYTLNGKTRKPLTFKDNALDGLIDPASDGYLSFNSKDNANVYIDVFVASNPEGYGSGKGLEYGPYAVYASANGSSGAALGIMTVDMKGAPYADMGWKILNGPGIVASKEIFYSAGTGVLLPEGDYVLVAKEAKNYAKPDSKGYATVKVEAGKRSEAPMYKYVDVADPLDDNPDAKQKHPTIKKAYAPTKLAPTAAKPVELSRSLWKGENGTADDVDWYTLSATAGSYYRFSLSGIEGEPEVSVYGPNNWTNECEYVIAKDQLRSVQICAEEKGTYYVKVAHAGTPVDSCYTLTASMSTPGVVKFGKTDVSVKDNVKDGVVKLDVSRTGKDGLVRVKYRTVGDQTNASNAYYYPTNGVLEWMNGDNKKQTIEVRVIPYNAWMADKKVQVVLEPFLEDDETFNPDTEYVASFDRDKKTGAVLDRATITVTASAKKVPGTIQVANCDTPKKPVFTVTAGETLEIPFERTAGLDGVVGVSVTTVKGTANKTGETDYDSVTENLVWEDGETGVKTVSISTKAVSGDYTPVKSFTLKIAALTSKKGDAVQYDKPTIAAASIAVNIANDKFKQTAAEYAKTLPKAGGVAVKEGKPNTWFTDEAGRLFSMAGGDFSFTLTGPGRFTVKAIGTNVFTTVGSGKTAQKIECAEGAETVMYVASGSQTIKFTSGANGGFDVFDGGIPYRWEPLAAVVPAAPTIDKAVVVPGTNELRFVREEGISYRVYALSSGAKNSANKALKLGDPETEVMPEDGRYLLDCVYEAKGNKGKYTWRVDSYFEDGTVTNVSKKAWNLTVLQTADGVPSTRVSGSGAWGEAVDAIGGTNIVLRQGVKASIEVGAVGSTVKSVAGAIPTGLKLEVDRATKQTYLRGTPTKAGAFQMLLQETDGKRVAGSTTVLDVTVEAAGSAIGTFNGLAMTFDTTNGIASVASVSITAAATGKLSAKVSVAGKSYTFADTGYSYVSGTQDDPNNPVSVTAELFLASKVGSGKDAITVTNWLYYTVYDMPESDEASWYAEGLVEIQMSALPDASGKGWQEDVWFSGKVYRDNSKLKDWQAAVADVAGYYTVSLVAPDAFYGEPCGSGYITLTLDAKGKAKVAGMLADGTKYSGASSAVVAMVGEKGDCSVRIPLYATSKTSVFGGWLALRRNGEGALVATIEAPDTDLVWRNDDPASTYDGEVGFSLYLQPVGGWYDTVANLQRAYLESDLAVSLPEGEDALEMIREALELDENHAFTAQPSGQAVVLSGNAMSVEKQVLVKEAANKKWTDWENSVNSANVTLKFDRKTGIVQGTFDLWYEKTQTTDGVVSVVEQKSIKGLKHYGVVLTAKGDDGYLEDDVLSSGFFLVPLDISGVNAAGKPVKRKWNASYRFDVNAVHIDREWEDYGGK